MPQHCLADISGPFYDLNKPFRNWSSMPFSQLDLDQPPYIDQAQLDWGTTRAISHIDELHAQGYTGIVIDNLAHLVSFAGTPAAYAAGDAYEQRAIQYRQAYQRLFQAAARCGMDVFITSDMQWSTPPLRRYIGRITPENPRLAAVNRWALAELFDTFPQVGGVVVRVGETGGAHDQNGYNGHLIYRTPRVLRDLIQSLLPICEQANRLLVVRTWSVGIGQLGDLLWSPERYQEVFGDLDSPYLLSSIKHGPADFFRMLPTNPTLGISGPQQIIELQNRREYELFGMVPSSIAALHQQVMQSAAANNPRFAGVWAWNSTGGWGGGSAVVGSTGWSVWTHLSSALTAALARDPSMDTTSFIQLWCADRFGAAFGAAVATLYLESADLITSGWYLGALSHQPPTLGRLYLPPLLWVWWLRPTAAPLIWSLLAASIPDHEDVLAAGANASARLASHAALLTALASEGDSQASEVVESVRYMADVFAVAQAIRGVMLPAFEAALAGDYACWQAIVPRVAALRAVLQRHDRMWRNRSDFPPLELVEIDAYLQALARHPLRFWLQARAAAALVQHMGAGDSFRRHAYATGLTAVALIGFGLAQTGVWRSRTATASLSLLLVPLLSRPILQRVLPWLSQRSYLLPSIFFETGPSVAEWAP